MRSAGGQFCSLDDMHAHFVNSWPLSVGRFASPSCAPTHTFPVSQPRLYKTCSERLTQMFQVGGGYSDFH